jgi:Copper type II ascorbate-dependent monooxygenase, C-terminal domain
MRKVFLVFAIVIFAAAAGARRRAAVHPEPPTFNKDVAPILQQHCQSCHRAGDIAPFALTTYADAVAVASQIKLMTQLRLMPPWKPEHGTGDFVGERRMSQREIDTIARWVDAGAREGRKEDAPPAPEPKSDWVLGTPDIVLSMRKPFTPPATRDEYRCFSMPVASSGDLWISTLDFRPGDRATVHHIILYIDPNGASAALDKDGEGFPCFGGSLVDDADALGGWSPGGRPTPLPEGTAIRLPRGARVLMQVHYSPHFARVSPDRTEVGLYLAKTEVRKELRYDVVANFGLFIPANAISHRVEATRTLPADIELVSIYPHMHLLGQRILVNAILPDGSIERLIHIPHYEFKWQGQYIYRNPVKLPRGTRLRVEAWYDNSENNPLNPSSPPKDVRWGEASTDEMCVALFGYTL